MMRRILIGHPTVDVVLGADTVVLGALRAVREQGKANSRQFFGGIDGEPEAIAELKSGGEYKASVSLASPVFGYALGQFAADWMDGRMIPQAMDVLPIPLSLETLAEYQADIQDPAKVFHDPEKQKHYLRMYGGICSDIKENFIDFPWTSESP